MEDNKNHRILKLSTKIVASYLINNRCKPNEIITIFDHIYEGLMNIENRERDRETSTTIIPAVPIENSIQQDKIICLEDGKPFKMLKRHLPRHLPQRLSYLCLFFLLTLMPPTLYPLQQTGNTLVMRLPR